jgi:hypothetical protein
MNFLSKRGETGAGFAAGFPCAMVRAFMAKQSLSSYFAGSAVGNM